MFKYGLFVQSSIVSISKPLRTVSNMLCANLRVRIVTVRGVHVWNWEVMTLLDRNCSV